VSLVLDASLTLSWYFEDERTASADALLDRTAQVGATVPSLWRLEVANGFRAAIRRKRIDVAYRDSALAQLTRMPITIDAETDARAWSTTLQLADRFGLSPYNAAYLELAHRERLPLASLDRPLRTAARSLGVEVLGAE
jgi:predicted nucleic acid-binding protein